MNSLLGFVTKMGSLTNFSFPRAPPQNGVVERKNRTLQESARTMLSDSNLPNNYWAEAIWYCMLCAKQSSSETHTEQNLV